MSVARVPRRWWSAAGIALVFALTVIGCYVEANPVHSYGGLHLARHPPAVAYLIVALAALALIWRDRAPVAVFALAVAGGVAWAGLGQIDGAALVPVIVALYWLALTRPRGVVLAAGLTGAVAIFVAEGVLGPFGWFGGPNATMWPELLAAAALGGYVAARRQWLAADRDRRAKADQIREEETRRRVDAERMRIARELHDVIAHSMAMINVQASAAAMLLADEPQRAADAIQAIRGASKAGLRELRAILNVLRQADTDLPEPAVPDLPAIRALAEAATAAGTPTSVEAGELAAPLPPPVALAAYRIVQESLTNVVRHAGPGTAAVAVRQDGSDLLVEVVNDGAPAAAAFQDGTGTGLAGMRERAAALGGALDAGPQAGGGFAVRARLPMTPATTAAERPPASPEPQAGPGPQAGPEAGGSLSARPIVSSP
jgi:signal transduction histidine kinase